MNTKITTPDGRFVLIVDRKDSKFTKTAFVSSTELQPFVCGNFDKEGTEIGGRTLTAKGVEAFIAAAKAHGSLVEVL